MAISIYELSKENCQKFFSAVIETNETFAPVGKFKNFSYQRVSKLDECDPSSPIKTTQGIKPLFFPRNSEIAKYKEDRSGVNFFPEKEDLLKRPKVLIGVKPCDAQSLEVLDKVMRWDHEDQDYFDRRANTVVVSSLCPKADETCFCTSLDYDIRTSTSSDLLLVETETSVLVQVNTEKGARFVEDQQITRVCGAKLLDEASAADKLDRQFGLFKESFGQKMDYASINEKLQGAFDSDQWNEAGKTCMGCNTCAFVCPTCHCFKIVDEKVKDCGTRFKCYDSCNSKYFTKMAGGHNPRPLKYRRWRQRGMHKFVYYKERFGVNLCVGCGKCAVACPVGISIFEVVSHVAASI